MLHIVNGDIVGDKLRAVGLPGAQLIDRELLHEGPVPGDASPAEFAAARADYFAMRGWAPREPLLVYFRQREEQLIAAAGEDEVVIWCEHDLYDQLLLARLLAWFAEPEHRPGRLSIISIGDYPGIEPFLGLGQLSGPQLAELLPARVQITEEQLELGARAWAAFGADTPEPLLELLDGETDALPFLGGALFRFLEEYPNVRDGLGRTQWQILRVISEGINHPREIFAACQELEEAVYLGDVPFYSHLLDLVLGEVPLLYVAGARPGELPLILPAMPPNPTAPEFYQQQFMMTEAGERVLYHKVDAIELRGGIDRWMGGVHLRGDDAAWRWDGENGLLIET